MRNPAPSNLCARVEYWRHLAARSLTDRQFLLTVCALNILLRLPLLALDVVPTSDFEWYYDAARSIAAGEGFADKGVLTAFWPLLAGGLRRWVGIVVLTGVMMAAVILAWTARNYTVFHRFIPVSTNGGHTLLTGNNPSAKGRYTRDDPLVADLSRDPGDQVEMDRLGRDRAWMWIKDNPATFVRLILLKIWRLWSGDGEAEWLYQSGYAGYEAHAWMFRAVRVANQVFYGLLAALAAASVPKMWRQRRSLPVWCWSGWAVMGYFTVISAAFSGRSRFHFALMPFAALYAAWWVAAWWRAQPSPRFNAR